MVGKIDLYRYSEGDWLLYKASLSLTRADHYIRLANNRLVAVSHGIVVAATHGKDLDLRFEEVITVEVAC